MQNYYVLMILDVSPENAKDVLYGLLKTQGWSEMNKLQTTYRKVIRANSEHNAYATTKELLTRLFPVARQEAKIRDEANDANFTATFQVGKSDLASVSTP